MYSHYLHAISIVCRSIRSNNGSNQTITAGLRFLALIAFYARGRINSSIDHLGSGSVHRFWTCGRHFSEYATTQPSEES